MAPSIIAPLEGTVVKVEKQELKTSEGVSFYTVAVLQEDEVIKLWVAEDRLLAITKDLPSRGDFVRWLIRVSAKVTTQGPALKFSLVSAIPEDEAPEA